MKKLILFLAFIMTLSAIFTFRFQPGANAAPSHSATFFVDQKTYIADGQAKAMDIAPFIENSRIYVPVRYLGQALGIPDSSITWDGTTHSVSLSLEGSTIRLVVGTASLYLDGQEQTMDVITLLKEGRVFLPARWVAQALGYEVAWKEADQAVLVGPPGSLPTQPGEVTPLPTIGTYENLKDLLAKAQAETGRITLPGAVPFPLRAAPELKSEADTQAGAGAADYSITNVQVEGVDEADIVKTDGMYIYQVNRERIIIAKAIPPEDMEIVSTLDFAGKYFSPQEIYVDDKHLVVIGQTYREFPRPLYRDNLKIAPEIMPIPYQQEIMKAIIYNIEDKSDIKKQRELELCGRYVSSRKIGKSLYLIANKHIYYYLEKEIEDPKPIYRDTAVTDEFMEIDYPEIKCFPDFFEPNYLIVAGLNLDRPEEAASVSSYLGAGENIYASTKNLYVAVTSYWYDIRPGGPRILPEIWPVDLTKTKIYKFNMSDGRLTYAASGKVPGTILNQFSMDEHNGYFRIATTKGEIWRTDELTSKNNVYVLDSSLKIVGKIEDIAPGEKIYSVRFMGDRGYLVTYKTLDPFFVIDLKDPYHPEVLGALKIPGYSDYLHPYDENHIIGFGKETVEIVRKDGESSVTAIPTGIKIALFDVSDVSNPVEMFKEKIGDKGTDSELLRNHKALLFSKDKNLLAFPVKVMEVKGSEIPGVPFPEYGTFTFQGAYVYNIDLAEGFILKGKITHLSREDYLKAGSYWYESEKNIERVIYIDDILYTLSKKYIKANDLSDLQEINSLEIRQ